ncbi:MAG: carboxypeptidase M32 [Nitrospirae bacterium]|nr:carboxypeptidase M32 [Nitrospirota bacterium]
MKTEIDELRRYLQTITALEQAAFVLMWDQATYMPAAGGHARGAQLAAIKQEAHQRATSPALGRLLDTLDAAPGLDAENAAMVRVARRDYEIRRQVPAALVRRIARAHVASHMAWEAARAANDFAVATKALEKNLELSRAYAACFPGAAHVADPLIDISDPGQTVAQVGPMFEGLRKELVPLVRAVQAADAPRAVPRGRYPQADQIAFSRQVATAIGYDFGRGRLDLSTHPFTVAVSADDVRITTRVREDDFSECLFSTVHEAGHGIYEQGIDRAFAGTPVAEGASAGLHESQSRLWENLVARSRPFWEHFYPRLQATFPEPLAGLELDGFLRAINRVRPSLIRTDADEVTYNLHVMMRFDLELELLSGALAVRDLPEAWVARMEADLGVTPPDHNLGALQDLHWFDGHVGGAFQGYTLGNVYSAQLFEAACRAHPDIVPHMAQGRFDTLRGWLTANVHRFGRAKTAAQVIADATGGAPDSAPYVAYLKRKYGAMYGLPVA